MKKETFQESVKVVENKKIAKDYFCLTLESKNIALSALPGQFVEVKVSKTFNPLLRRPFGVHKVTSNKFSILCQIVGEGTKALSKVKAGEFLDVIGPLGNGFDSKSPNHPITQSPIIVAGGMGVAPLTFLAEKLVAGRRSPVAGRPTVLIGAKTKNHILCKSEFEDLGCEVSIATDDGSQGFKGRVTELVNNLLATADSRPQTIYACGPKPMLKEISRISKQYNIPAQISLEAHMSCGFGACLGCVVNTKDGYKRVCKEGPVLKAEEIIWD